MLYPEGSQAARSVLSLAYSRRITDEDNGALRPEEHAAVTVDRARGQLYVGGRGGYLMALGLERGEVRWEVPVPGGIGSVPVLAEDGAVLLFGSDDGLLTALDLETRKPRWTYQTDGIIRNAVVEGDGVVYFANSRDEVYALDIRSGAWRWWYQREFQVEFTVQGRAGLSYRASDDEGEAVLYTGFDDGRAVAIDARSGEALWITSVAPPEGGAWVDCDSTPLLREDEVIVAGQATGVYGLAREDGSIRWSRPVRAAGSVVQGPAGSLLFSSSLEGLHAIDPGGALRWRAQLDPGVVSTPLVVDDVVFVTHSESGVLAYDVTDGEMLARVDTGSGVSSVPVFDADLSRFFAVSNRGTLLAFNVPVADSQIPASPAQD